MRLIRVSQRRKSLEPWPICSLPNNGMSEANLIGCGKCPICGNSKARFTVSKKMLACMTCNACNVQIFARSDNSDERLRGFIAPAKPEPVEIQQVAAETVEKVTPPAPTPETKKPAPGFTWGVLGATHGD